MKTFNNILSFVVFFILILTTSTVFSQNINPDADREIIVMFKPNIVQLPSDSITVHPDRATIASLQIRNLINQFNVDRLTRAFPEFNPADTLMVTPEGIVVTSLDLSRVFTLRLPANIDRTTLITALSTLSEIIYAEPNANAILRAPIMPNDQHFGLQWGMHNTGQSGGTIDADIDAPEAWEIFQGTSNIRIAIVDGGVNTNHTDLSGRLSGSTGSSNHATHVAGIAAAKGNNSTGVAGVDWNCLINSQIIGSITQSAQAVINAVNAGAKVLNNSWGQGSNTYSVTMANAFATAYKANASSFNAMPEDGSPEDYPNAYGQGIINVGALRNDGKRATYSHAKTYIDVAAPGGNGGTPDGNDIYSTYPNNSYAYLAGTSMAAPHATGIGSLLAGYANNVLGKTLYNDDIENIIRISADDVNDPNDPTTGSGWDQGTGTGRVNARKALDFLRSPYTLNQWTVTNGTIYSTSGTFQMTFYSTPGLADGVYIVKRYVVRKTVTFPSSFSSTPYVWGRGVATNGYSYANPNFGMGFCQVVGTVTTTQATLETVVYEVWTISGQYKGFVPTTPSNAVFGYTALGVQQPLAVTITGPTALGYKQQGTWTANASAGTGSYTYEWRYRYNGTGSWSGVVGTSQQYSRTMLDTDFELQVKVTSGGQSVYDTHYVSYEGLAKPTIATTVKIPDKFALQQNYPNPFNPTTEIKYDLPDHGRVILSIFNVMGQKIRTLVDEQKTAGYHSIIWDSKDEFGNEVASGIYIYRIYVRPSEIRSKPFESIKKMTLLR